MSDQERELERMKAKLEMEKHTLRRLMKKRWDAIVDYLIIMRWVRWRAFRYRMMIQTLKLAENFGAYLIRDYDYRRKDEKKRRPRLWFIVTLLVNLTQWLRPSPYKQCGVRLMREVGPCTKPLITARNIRHGRCEYHMLTEDLRRRLIREYREKHGRDPIT